MKASFIALLGALTLSGMAAAQEEQLVGYAGGTFRGSGQGKLELTVIQLDKNLFAASMSTLGERDRIGGRCVGDVSGMGWVEGNTLIITNTMGREFGECKILLTFVGRTKDTVISKTQGDCTPFHGAACGFEGRLTRQEYEYLQQE